MSAKRAKTKKKTSRFRVRVTVMPRRAVLDPQGQAIHQALGRLGFKQISAVRAGKSFVLTVDAEDAAAATAAAEDMGQKLLANPVVEDYAVDLVEEVEEASS